jgi:hypothetical protein
MLDGEAEMLEQHSRRRGLGEAIDADDCRARIIDRADVLVAFRVTRALLWKAGWSWISRTRGEGRGCARRTNGAAKR